MIKKKITDLIKFPDDLIINRLGDLTFIKVSSEFASGTHFQYETDRGTIQLIVQFNPINDLENSVLMVTPVGYVRLTDGFKEPDRFDEISNLMLNWEFEEFAEARIRWMNYKNVWKRKGHSFSDLINQTNNFIELKNLIDNSTRDLTHLVDFNPNQKLNDNKAEIKDRSFVPSCIS